MKIFLETERLILRQFTENDADNLLELNSDPEVVRFTPDAGNEQSSYLKPSSLLPSAWLLSVAETLPSALP
jgi:[ribosomal protein S5]-alanine N-acetyltransferase